MGGKAYTQTEIETLTRLFESGITYAKIAEQMNRSQSSIHWKIAELGFSRSHRWTIREVLSIRKMREVEGMRWKAIGREIGMPWHRVQQIYFDYKNRRCFEI